MSIFIVSNRRISDDRKSFSSKNGESAQTNFRIAKCSDAKAQKTLSYKILEDTTDPDYDKVINVIENRAEIETLQGTESMFYELYKNMKDDTKKHSDTLFFIHGFATSHEDEKLHILELQHLYIDNDKSPIEHLVYISWPTANNYVLSYWSDKNDAMLTGQALQRIYYKLSSFMYVLFRKYQNPNCGNKIHLMAHSMGNQVLGQMLNCLDDEMIIPFLGQIFILHADVDADIFENDKAFSKLKKLGQRTHIYVHKSDDALTISTTTKNFKNRLGKSGPTNIKDFVLELFVVDVTDVKFEAIKNKSFFENLKLKTLDHWGYLYSKAEINDIIAVLNGTDERRIVGRKRHDIYTNYFYLESEHVVEVIS